MVNLPDLNQQTQLMRNRVFNFFEQQPQWVVLAVAIALVVIVGAIDVFIRSELTISIFYLIPVSLSAWYGGYKAGILIALLSAIAWLQADLVTNNYTHFWSLYWNTGVRFKFLLIVTFLLTSLRAAYERERQLARLDSLTQVYNRRFFMEALAMEMSRARRYCYPITLVYLDVDNFKAVNDQRGHSAGDRLLKKIADRIRDALRVSDLVARLGGDEFVILLPHTDAAGAKAVLPRLHQTLLGLNPFESCAIGFSMGAVTFTTLPDSVDALIMQADQLMYKVKRSGKNGLEYRQI